MFLCLAIFSKYDFGRINSNTTEKIDNCRLLDVLFILVKINILMRRSTHLHYNIFSIWCWHWHLRTSGWIPGQVSFLSPVAGSGWPRIGGATKGFHSKLLTDASAPHRYLKASRSLLSKICLCIWVISMHQSEPFSLSRRLRGVRDEENCPER